MVARRATNEDFRNASVVYVGMENLEERIDLAQLIIDLPAPGRIRVHLSKR